MASRALPPSMRVSGAIFLLLCLLAAFMAAPGHGATLPAAARGTRPAVEKKATRPDSALMVLAAASLADVLPVVAGFWEEAGGMPVRFSFDGTSRLAPQTLQGIEADLFISADETWMDWVEDRGGLLEGTRIRLLGNRLVVVVPSSASERPAVPEDLWDPWITHLALAGENVPAGRYGQAALQATGVWESLGQKVVRASNVRGALEWVARSEAEAGVVYRTDALAEDRVEEAFVFAEATHPPIVYPGAVLSGAHHAVEAREFLAFCLSGQASNAFEAAGFVTFGAVQQAGEESTSQPESPLRVHPASPNPWSAVKLSFLVALASTLAGFFPAVWLGWILARKEFWGKTVISTIVLVPLVLPPVVTGFILLSVFGAQSPLGSRMASMGIPVPFTILGATLAALTVGLPLYVISVRNAFQAVDPSYEDVAATLGQPPWRTFRRVSFPLALPGIVAGGVLAFARALGEFGATVVLAGNVEGSTRTIALAVYTLLESPQGRESIWVLVGASVVLSLLALLGFEALSRHQRRQMGGRRGH